MLSFGQQHASSGHAGGVELPELHVLQWNARTGGHAQAVTGVDEGIGTGGKNAACTTGGQQCGFGFQNVDIAGFHFEGGHAHHVAVGIADQIKRHPLHEEVGAGLHVLLVQRVQHGMTGAVSSRASALNGFFTVVGGVAAKWALVDRAIWVAVKRHAHVFQLVHHLGSFAAHELDGVLVAQPIGAFDGVVEVVMPVVFGHVAQRSTDTTLGSHRVAAGGKYLGQNGHIQAGASQLQGGTHAGAACTDDNHIETALGHRRSFCHGFRASRELEWPSPGNPRARRW